MRAWREAAITCGLVALAGVTACVLRTVLGPAGCVIILLAPVLVAGSLYGLRTALLAAGLAYLVYAFLIPAPFVPSKPRGAGRNLTLPVFILAALIAGGFARALRAWRRGAAGAGSDWDGAVDELEALAELAAAAIARSGRDHPIQTGSSFS